MGLAFVLGYDWIGVFVVIIVFIAIKGRQNLDAPSFWYGEITALLVIDLWVFIYAMGIPVYAENIAYIIVNFIPALLISVVALIYFGRKQRANSKLIFSPPDRSYPKANL